MYANPITIGFGILVLSAGALAGPDEEKEVEVKIAIADSGNSIVLDLDSNELGFDPLDLQDGESRSIVTPEGQNVLITNTGDGFTINVDGTDIALPHLGGMDDHGGGIVKVEIDEDGGSTHTVDVHNSVFISDGQSPGITIISSDALDDSTKASIRSVLQSAGHDVDVQFIDGSGERKVEKKIVIKTL